MEEEWSRLFSFECESIEDVDDRAREYDSMKDRRVDQQNRNQIDPEDVHHDHREDARDDSPFPESMIEKV